ncbi:hypothetical protein BpHYR1_017306 [Brachionus plicatilis]|uniref:Uncharacterized protein n=1 Tax=Brachionus plicatilis TaxID=10195 RepID=A0A3M7R4I6_BRAPC|nr:hypothetical protein BpHYR1_017306 [Brachionus plicatilis]
MSSSASILVNNFNDTSNDANYISTKEFKKLVKILHFVNVTWNFYSTSKLADCDKHTYNCKFNKKVKNVETNGSVYVSDNQHSNHSNNENSAAVLLQTKEKNFRSLGQTKKIRVTQELFCEKCGAKMTKRRYWACPNKCDKNNIFCDLNQIKIKISKNFYLNDKSLKI